MKLKAIGGFAMEMVEGANLFMFLNDLRNLLVGHNEHFKFRDLHVSLEPYFDDEFPDDEYDNALFLKIKGEAKVHDLEEANDEITDVVVGVAELYDLFVGGGVWFNEK